MRIYRAATLMLVVALNATDGVAQSFEEYAKAERERYNTYVNDTNAEWKRFRDEQNAAYADLLRQRWSREEPSAPIPQPTIPEPPKPMVADPDSELSSMAMPVGSVVTLNSPIVVEPPKPIIPTPTPTPAEAEKPKVEGGFLFDYYGTRCSINIEPSQRISLSSINEEGVANAWSILSKDSYTAMVSDCLVWRDRLELSDWGYVRLIEDFTLSFCGESGVNEARVMQMFILTQSGYEARIARTDDGLVLLLPFTSQIYEYSYLNIDGGKYYVIGESKSNSFYVFNQKFPNEQRLSLQLSREPRLDMSQSQSRTLSSQRYEGVVAEVATNKNLIDFYNDFPRNNDWGIYSKASLSEEARSSLYPSLRRSIEGQTELEAVNIILNFVQTAFEYQTDDEQFGYERPLFADESLFYPYCDCEDRSILFSVLVRELVGCDVVFLSYPQHLATAVRFKESVEGDYFVVDNARYTVCDPTYIGAKVGLSMPNFKSVGAEVIKMK